MNSILATHASAQVRLPRLISDGMVLQRDTKVSVWGWARPGEKVKVTFRGNTYPTTTSADGQWKIQLRATKAGGPFRMDIQASNHIVLNDVWVGDVWVLSGQSNMVIPMERVKERYPDEIAQANYPAIRQFTLPTRYNLQAPQVDFASGNWQPASPQTILPFSAVGYFFAQAIYTQYRVPVGLIQTAVGGSPIEAWLSEEALKSFPAYLDTAIKYRDTALVRSIQRSEQKLSKNWYHQLNATDMGLRGTVSWYDSRFDASRWPTLELPTFWADAGLPPTNGVYWFRKDFEIPAAMAGKPAKLRLGRLVDQDSVFLNGTFVGTTGYQYPPRRYDVPAGLLREGKNMLVVRLINTSGKGGFAIDKPYQLSAAGQTIDLKGTWQYQLGAVMDSLPPTTFFQYKPLGLFNGMIAPLLNASIKGVLWYQGESNTDHPGDYDQLLPALINDWRRKWKQQELPFLYVQLANFGAPQQQPVESAWAQVREAQRKTLGVPYTGMAVAIDLGEWNDLHPLNKKDVGQRLALAARKVAYGETKLTASGPLYQSIKREKDALRITFAQTGSGLIAQGGGQLRHFALAGADRKFVWAQARIEGNSVVVSCPEVPHPEVVRYAWADNPEGANLYNREGLPASPFEAEVETPSPSASH